MFTTRGYIVFKPYSIASYVKSLIPPENIYNIFSKSLPEPLFVFRSQARFKSPFCIGALQKDFMHTICLIFYDL